MQGGRFLYRNVPIYFLLLHEDKNKTLRCVAFVISISENGIYVLFIFVFPKVMLTKAKYVRLRKYVILYDSLPKSHWGGNFELLLLFQPIPKQLKFSNLKQRPSTFLSHFLSL